MEIRKQERTTRREIKIGFTQAHIEQLIKDKLSDCNIDLRKAAHFDINFHISQGEFDDVTVDIVFEEIEEEG